MMNVPSSAHAAQALDEARELFARTLAAWVGDLLTLRRAGLDRAAWTACRAQRRWNKAA